MKKYDLRKISVTAMFSAVAFLCTFIFRFKVMFLTFDLKDAIISIVSLLFGPLYGIFSAGIVAFFELISFSETGIYGMLMNFISSATFALTCGIIYRYKRSFFGAILAVSLSVVTVTSVMMVANIFITPYYMGVKTSEVITLLPKLLFPFNICKSLINAASVLIIYKPITNALKRTGLINKTKDNKSIFSIKSVVLIIVSLVIIILTILFLILSLGGSFELFRS